MPAYSTSPFGPRLKLLSPGIAEYFFGSWTQDVSPTQMYVSSVAIAANVATLGVTVFGGNLPAVGSLISVQGSQTGGGQFNVVNAVLTGVNLNSAGVGTVTFALTGANLPVTTDAGVAIVPVPEVAETLVNGASAAVAAPNDTWGGDLNSQMAVSAYFPTLPTAATIVLQGANFNQDAQFVTVGTVATVAGGAVTANGLVYSGTYLFFRLLVTGVTGVGSVIAKIEA